MREIADCATLCTQHMVVSRSQTIFLFFLHAHTREGKEKGLVKLHRPACVN